MKIIKKDIKHGVISISVENPDDLWYLSQLIDSGDSIKGKTVRKIKATEEADAAKKAVFMEIIVEKVDFSESSTALRVNGKMVEGPEEVARGSYHTFSVEQGSKITITKEKWFEYQLERLKEAAEQAAAKILICVFDREDAYFALMKRSGASLLSHLKGDVQKKRMQTKAKGNFYSEIIKQLEEYDKRYKLNFIILASPSFWKEELFKVLSNDMLKKKIIPATCSSADERAIDEVLKREEVRNALKQERTSQELVYVEKVLEEISKEGQVAYGMKQVETAVEAGAAEKLLVTDKLIQKLRKEEKFDKLNKIMKSVEKQRGKVVIISSSNEGGKKLDGIGGVAALLRYKLTY